MGRAGFTVAEVLMAALIAAVFSGVLFYALNSGESSKNFSSAKQQAQAEARRALDWIARDARQAVSWEIANVNNNPNSAHIKFKKVEGWDTANNTYVLSANYTDYSYNSTAEKLTRVLMSEANATLQSWYFNNITQTPFYTEDPSGGIVSLNSNDLLTSRKLIVTVAASKPVKAGLNAAVNLTEEIKIRNE